MKRNLFAIAILRMLATVAQARAIDWQAELDHSRALREQMEPLLRAGKGYLQLRAPGRWRASAFRLNGVRYDMVRARR